MKIDSISITPTLAGNHRLHIESGGYTFDGGFDDLMSFAAAVSGAVKYFGLAHGLLERRADGTFQSKVKK